jgi:hypothetical protein
LSQTCQCVQNTSLSVHNVGVYSQTEHCTETQSTYLCIVPLPVMDKFGIKSIIKTMDDSQIWSKYQLHLVFWLILDSWRKAESDPDNAIFSLWNSLNTESILTCHKIKATYILDKKEADL